MPAGRPSKYTDETPAKVKEYLQVYESLGHVLPSIAGLSVFLGVTRETIHQWVKAEDKAEFSDSVRMLQAEQELKCGSGGLEGTYNASICKLFMHQHGYSDKVEQKASGEITIKVSEQDTRL